jgi:cytochrome c biogenesis protein CcdA
MKKKYKSQLIILGIILVVLLVIFIPAKKVAETEEEIAKCIGEKSTLYVQVGCSHCRTQENILGENINYIEIVDCFYEPERCSKIKATPTWEINGEYYIGVKSFDELKEWRDVKMSEFLRITGLALADSVNPCAIAVLTMVLVSILVKGVENKNKKNVLKAGLAFCLAVFISYLFYGIVIVEIFKSLDIFLRNSSIYVNKGLAILAILIGILNVKDYLNYKQGSIGTEMPLFLRPKVKKIIEKITSPKGAFFIGFLVTVFLLPCTMGPYITASGTLATLPFIKIIPWLIYYNIFIYLADVRNNYFNLSWN